MSTRWKQRSLLVTCAFVVAGVYTLVEAQQQTTPAQQAANQVAIDANDIGGVVAGAAGPEAGVWVIAETTDLPTKYRKIVVTDDLGRFVLPDLPARASYRVWVRGYGLIDSGLTVADPGAHLALTATRAPTAKAAAQYYPANYWLSLMRVPPKEAFPMAALPGTPSVEGQPPRGIETQAEWVGAFKRCAGVCHQMGNKFTREINPSMGTFDSTAAAWDYRIRMGQVGKTMATNVELLGKERALAFYADWTDRIAAGEVPEAPPRPAGLERNIVLTIWDVGRPVTFLHDTYATDKRNPTVNGYGPVYGGDYNEGILTILDPVKHTAEVVKIPTRDELSTMNRSANANRTMQYPSLYFGEELVFEEFQRTEVKNIDEKGRLWMMTSFRKNANQPAWCKAGSGNKFAEVFPINSSQRQIAMYDPKTKKFTYVDTCFSTHHAGYGEDRDNMFYNAGPDRGGLLSWVNLRLFEETGDAEKSQGWCPAYYDTNDNGKYDKGVDPLETATGYYITFNPKDKSVWYTLPGVPGKIVRMDVGANPPETCRSEIYEPPYYNAKAPKNGYFPRGIDVDRDTGLIWTGLAGSGQLASFDRTKCRTFKGSESIDGQRCVEGWTLYDLPGPQMQGITDGGTSDFIYGNWVDQFDTFGLGRNVPILNGTNSDSLIALVPETKKWVVLRVPYPMGFHTRNLAGRIDDPKAGWKGRGLWAGNEVRNPWHIEGGKGTTPHDVQFQLRPDPLAH